MRNMLSILVAPHYAHYGETPTKWKNRIWNRLMYFQNKKYYTYDEKDYFCVAKPYLIDGNI
jgi:hypothetical protein